MFDPYKKIYYGENSKNIILTFKCQNCMDIVFFSIFVLHTYKASSNVQCFKKQNSHNCNKIKLMFKIRQVFSLNLPWDNKIMLIYLLNGKGLGWIVLTKLLAKANSVPSPPSLYVLVVLYFVPEGTGPQSIVPLS